jgi:hypothetical protein
MDFSGGFDSKDIVFSEEGGEIKSGGFSINSLFLKLGVSPLHTLITKFKKGGVGGDDDNEEDEEEEGEGNNNKKEEKVSKLLYDGFAVPIGLLCERNNNDNYYDYDDEYDEDNVLTSNILGNDFYDKLLDIQVETNNKINKLKKKKMTRKKLLPVEDVVVPDEKKPNKHKKTRKQKKQNKENKETALTK